MRALDSYDYAILRVAPSVEREEFVNAGVVLHCAERAFLDCRVHLDESRLRALWPAVDLEIVRQHLEAFPRICKGDPEAGPIAQLPRRERFQWIVAPRSTIIQVSPVHSGVSDAPESALEEIFRRLVMT
ncbi:MAG TPA: DUF3037 domain-containing protein [Bryobacteraceae bacterium]|nr:DUF3037 domain-containing protein [Bryobacteraceae bacterium]